MSATASDAAPAAVTTTAAAAATTSFAPTTTPLDAVDLLDASPSRRAALTPLARSAAEKQALAESAGGGITAFRGLPIEAIKRYYYIAVRPTELTAQNIPQIFPTAKKEFALAAMYAPAFVNAAVKLGLLPMTIRLADTLPEFLAVKLHQKRSIIRVSPQTIRIPHGLSRKKTKKFALVVDGGLWDTCIAAITTQHEAVHGHSWLNPYLTKTFFAMNCEPEKFATNLHCISVVHAHMVPQLVAARKAVRDAIARGGADAEASIAAAKSEFAKVAQAAFCAGEIGCSVGVTYTSLTGAYCVSGAGSVQLGALAALLVQTHMETWDMGMQMEYKEEELGATEIRRNQWLPLASANAAKKPPGLSLGELDGYAVRVDAIIAAAVPPVAAEAPAAKDGAAAPAAASSAAAQQSTGSKAKKQQQQQQKQQEESRVEAEAASQ